MISGDLGNTTTYSPHLDLSVHLLARLIQGHVHNIFNGRWSVVIIPFSLAKIVLLNIKFGNSYICNIFRFAISAEIFLLL